MRKKLIIGAVVPLVASLGLWLGSGAATAHATSSKARVQTVESTTGPDTDNIQSGDQTGPDTATTAGTSGESSGENSSESSGEGSGASDGPGGHQDPPGNVNHECTGNCQE